MLPIARLHNHTARKHPLSPRIKFKFKLRRTPVYANSLGSDTNTLSSGLTECRSYEGFDSNNDPPKCPLLGPLWSLTVGIWGILESSGWGGGSRKQGVRSVCTVVWFSKFSSRGTDESLARSDLLCCLEQSRRG